MDLETIEREALELSVEDRAKLAHELLESLDSVPVEQLDDIWMREADRRMEIADRGQVEPIPSEEVLRKAKSLLR